MSSAVSSLGTSYELLVGPLLIGVFINALVFGICVMQFIGYFLAGYDDNWALLGMLCWIYVSDALQVGISVSMLWHYVVDNFTNPAALTASPWECIALPVFSAFASIPIQVFMAYRIMCFSHSRFLFLYISALSLAQGALACTSAALGHMNTTAKSVSIIPVADAWLALRVTCDTSITVLLLYYLLKSQTRFERAGMDSIISRICAITVKAAVPATVFSILDLCFLMSTPNNNLHYMFTLPIGRLYTNTLLSMLNERMHLRLQMENATPNRQGIRFAAITSSKHRFQNRHPAQVRINIEQDVDVSAHRSDMDARGLAELESVSVRHSLSATAMHVGEYDEDRDAEEDKARPIGGDEDEQRSAVHHVAILARGDGQPGMGLGGVESGEAKVESVGLGY